MYTSKKILCDTKLIQYLAFIMSLCYSKLSRKYFNKIIFDTFICRLLFSSALGFNRIKQILISK